MMFHVIKNSSSLFCYLSVLSEILGAFRVYPIAYFLKVCVDMPKEMLRPLIFQSYSKEECIMSATHTLPGDRIFWTWNRENYPVPQKQYHRIRRGNSRMRERMDVRQLVDIHKAGLNFNQKEEVYYG